MADENTEQPEEQPKEKTPEVQAEADNAKPTQSGLQLKFGKKSKAAVAIVLLAGVFRLFSSPTDTSEFTQSLDPVQDAELIQDIESLDINVQFVTEAELNGKQTDIEKRADGGYDILIMDHGDLDANKRHLKSIIDFMDQKPSTPDLSK